MKAKRANKDNENFESDLEEIKHMFDKFRQNEGNDIAQMVINYYGNGSNHIDNVACQTFISGAVEPKNVQKVPKATAKEEFNDDTPLSALFRDNHYDELKEIINSWLPFLTNVSDIKDPLSITSFQFVFGEFHPANVYLDLVHLVNLDALKTPLSVLADYLFTHSNLSVSRNSIYVQLKRYKKLCK